MSGIEVGYWSIRGLGAPLRMMVLYAGHPLKAVNYDLKGTDDGFSASTWMQDTKPDLKLVNPLINLPYIKDGEKVISQSNACLLYLGRKFDMLGNSVEDLEDCEQLLCEIYDLRNRMTGFAYDPTSNNEAAQRLIQAVTSPSGILQKLELWLKREVTTKGHSGTFLVANKATAPDFHLWELLDQFEALSKFFDLPPALELSTFPYLAAFQTRFAERSENAKYLASKLYRMPMNNKSAAFGATLDGHKWTKGTKYEFGDYSGDY
jgi:glutathione S-transferase